MSARSREDRPALAAMLRHIRRGDTVVVSSMDRLARSVIDLKNLVEEVRAEEMNGTNVTGVKAALKLLGDDCGATRPPSAWPLTDKQHDKLVGFYHVH